MTHWKGPVKEREVAAMFNEEGFAKARRALGAGRQDDVGDIESQQSLIRSCLPLRSSERTVMSLLLPSGSRWIESPGSSY